MRCLTRRHEHSMQSAPGLAVRWFGPCRACCIGLNLATSSSASAPGTPVVFVPGIAGSVLAEGHEVRWPTVSASNIRALNLRSGVTNLLATDVLRVFDDPSVPFGLARTGIYRPFLQYLVSMGHVEFDLAGDPVRLISDYLVTSHLDPVPTLFPFPFDWRQGNATHTATLNQYIRNIQQVHGGAKVSFAAHSMGGLLVRRYLLEYGTSNVNSVVTVGSPFWGAPVSTYRMMVGDLFGIGLLDWWDNGDLSAALRTFPAFHELLPSDAYMNNAATPVFAEDRWDSIRTSVPKPTPIFPPKTTASFMDSRIAARTIGPPTPTQ
jgi:pimeloyl-ACP methyl ester carboxylesterase